MNQPVPEELISAFFDGEVTPEERGQVEQLLESSAELRQLLEDTSKISALLHSFPRAATPEELAANVQTRIGSLPVIPAPEPPLPKRSFRREWSAMGIGLIATMASLICFGVFFQRSQDRNESGKLAGHKSAAEPMNRGSGAYPEKEGIAMTSRGGDHPSNPMQSFERKGIGQQLNEANAPAIAAMSVGEGLGDRPGDATGDFSDASLMKLPSSEAFLKNLKTGDVVTQLVDTDNSVVIVNLTVVDIYKGTEGLKVLFQKHRLPQIANDETTPELSNDELSTVASRRSKQKKAAVNDLMVVYVRGPSSDVADTLRESLNKQPELYRRLEPQSPLPITVPVGLNSNSIDLAARDGQNEAPKSGDAARDRDQDVVNDQQPVSVEGKLFTNLFADRNGMVLEDSRLNESDPEKQKARSVSAVPANGKLAARTNPVPADAVSKDKADVAQSAANQLSDAAAKAASEKAGSEATKASGYATFHLAMNSQRPAMRANLAQGQTINQNTIKSNEANPASNPLYVANTQTAPFNFNNFGNSQTQSQNMGRRGTRSPLDARDPRLVRMLIVLKTEQPNPATTP